MAHIGLEDFHVGQWSSIPLTGTGADMGNTIFRLFTLDQATADGPIRG